VVRIIYLDAILFLSGGIIGTAHHWYWTGQANFTMALAAMFSALEVVPLTLLTLDAWDFIKLTGTKGAGAVYLFYRLQNEWVESAKLSASDAARGDQFAFNVAASGNIMVVGARRADPFGFKDARAVYLFRLTGKEWGQIGKLTASDLNDGDEFGHSVAMNGDLIAVGARRADIDGARNQGAVYLFRRYGNQWEEEAKITASDPEAEDEFAHSLASHGNKVAVGANIADVEESDQGTAYVYQLKK
jgi:hypothetical protein